MRAYNIYSQHFQLLQYNIIDYSLHDVHYIPMTFITRSL